MPSYYFPCLFLVPAFEEDALESNLSAMRKRRWGTPIFDLATLATRHRLHMPYQVMDVLLQHCNLEVEVKDAEAYESAVTTIELIRAMLYVQDVGPFIVPFCTTHSVNEYSGINYRDSEILRAKLPEEQRNGITSATDTVEGWPHEMVLHYGVNADHLRVTADTWNQAMSAVAIWGQLEAQTPRLRAARRALCTAPGIQDSGSSLLHLWQGIEALFPTVNVKVSFRLSLLVSQLCAPLQPPSQTYRACKRAYGTRSRIAHGSSEEIPRSQVEEGWSLLVLCLRAVLFRTNLPGEDELMTELLESRNIHGRVQ